MSALAAKNALRLRVRDIAVGSAGYNFDGKNEFATAEFLSRFVPALKETFDREGRSHLWLTSNLNCYDNIDTTTDFLFSHGVRATDRKEYK